MFLILIAVALFAALSYVVLYSTRSGGGSVEDEKAQLEVANLENYVTAVQTALLRLKFARNVETGSIYLDNNVYTRNDGSPLPPPSGNTDMTLNLFHPEGGGVPARTFPDAITDCPSCPTGYVKPGHMLISWIRPQWLGDPVQNDVAITFFGVTERICRLINERNGISGIPSVAYSFTSRIIALNFDGSPYGATSSSNVLGDLTNGSSGIEGHTAWCALDTDFPRYVFTSVIEQY